MYRILFVCTGNICRSPSADAVLRHEAAAQGLHLTVDSCGTHGYHIGEAPDPRAIRVAAQQGIAMDQLRARKLEEDDFYDFDILLAMDHGHLKELQRLQPRNSRARIELYLPFCGIESPQEVPDPYYGEIANFEYVLELVQDATVGLLQRLQSDDVTHTA
tara:strand:+ start:398 stop:877 length:480 start_codon:yes stop_codon:yes gene_type:complete